MMWQFASESGEERLHWRVAVGGARPAHTGCDLVLCQRTTIVPGRILSAVVRVLEQSLTARATAESPSQRSQGQVVLTRHKMAPTGKQGGLIV